MQITTFWRISKNVLGKIGIRCSFVFSLGRLLKFAQKWFLAFFGVWHPRFWQKFEFLVKTFEWSENIENILDLHDFWSEMIVGTSASV